MKILVTGASGFVGKNLISRLSPKYCLYGFSRRKIDGINYFEGDITSIESLEKAIVNVDTVIHLAGLIRGSKKSFYATNVLGARNLCILASKYNIKKIIYVSSLAALGPLEKNEPVSYYGYTKRLGELELLKNSHVYNLVVLRPPVIYGPNEQEIYKLIKLAKKTGIFFVIKNMKLSFIYVDDLVDAIDAVLQRNLNEPKIYTICENTHYNFFEIANIIIYHLSQNIKIVTLPDVILDAIFFGFKKGGIFFDKINEINAHLWVCNSNKFCHDFGFKTKYDLFNGMYKTIRWYRENGWL